ncbi:hypothetical protein [Gordonia sp. KTR9]|nr:hypothetical protein [Gordonia sp. KTR9]
MGVTGVTAAVGISWNNVNTLEVWTPVEMLATHLPSVRRVDPRRR